MKFLLMRRKFIVMDYRPTVQWYAHTRYEIRRSSQLSHLKRSGNIVIAERDYTDTVSRLVPLPLMSQQCKNKSRTSPRLQFAIRAQSGPTLHAHSQSAPNLGTC